MNTTPASIQGLAQRLLTMEIARRPLFDPPAHEAAQVCETLRITLTQFIGADGFTALLRRALALARADFPALRTVTITTDGRLAGFEEFAALEENGIGAATAITAQLLGLLVNFIGESLTLRLIRGAWPEAFSQPISESEDF